MKAYHAFQNNTVSFESRSFSCRNSGNYSALLLRNLHEFQRPILTTTHSGYTLYLANNPEIYRHYETTRLGHSGTQKFHAKRSKLSKALEAEQIKDNTKEAELFQDYWTREEAKQLPRRREHFVLLFHSRRRLWQSFPTM